MNADSTGSASVNSTLKLLAVGDVFTDIPRPQDSLAPLKPVLSSGDVVFGNCEGFYSDRPAPAPTHKHYNGTSRAMGESLGEAPFHVMTCANNHIMDGGYQGLADTLELLAEQGIATTGAGGSLASATAPAIIERNGIKVAFLGFCSVFPTGYEARANRPGLAPLRVETLYRNADANFWEPGISPKITTVPLAEDVARLEQSIADARTHADFVVVAHHWGYSSLLEDLLDYELVLARHTVDSGADAVVCHHHHSLRGIELHGGKPIFYGLGTLVHHFAPSAVSQQDRLARQKRFGPKASMSADDAFPLFPFSPDARMTGIAVLDIEVAAAGAGPACRIGFLPALILANGTTEPLRADDPRADEVCAYVQRLSRDSGFDTSFQRSQFDGWSMLNVERGPAALT